MITSDKRIAQDDFANLTDYSAVCPEGLKRFFVYVHFTDWKIQSGLTPCAKS